MSDVNTIAQILEKSLNSSTAKESELALKNLELQQGFPLSLLHVVASDSINNGVRLAGALYFKNLIKRKWIGENGNYLIDLQDVGLIKREIIGLMIQLPDQLQVQIGESISLIAESEFPELWPELLDELLAKLSADDMILNKGVLKVAHSIFKRWRPLFRSDELFLEIKMVLDKFSQPFLDLFKRVDYLIDNNNGNKKELSILFENLLLLVKIYYDLNCQDIPEFFEDHLSEGMNILLKYLKYHNPLLEDPNEDEEIDIVTQVKINICELIQLYTTRYEEEFTKFIPSFIQTIWDLLNEITIQQKYDILTSKALQFMTAIANISRYSSLLNNEESLKQITEKIILPNVTLRELDEEMFEDDPIEFTRRDLEGSDSDTRRRASTEFLRALKESNEHTVTQVIMKYVNHYLLDYSNNRNWKSKDLAIYLFSAIASKGSLTNAGITVTNLLVDVVGFFTTYVYPDLIGEVSHPILKVDAIKYIFTFRNQLTKQQLIETFPLLSSHFQSDNYVVYTYTAITIEKILSLRNPTNHQELLFGKNDIPPNILKELLMNLFRLMFKKGDTPEKLAENEFLVKCIMRILLNSEDSLKDSFIELLRQLLKIVEIISKNPSNPKFSHYTFESICVILKYNSPKNELFEIVKPTMLGILGQDIQEFIPYSFQILSYILENYPRNMELPIEYEQLIKPLCSPAVWEFKGNVPAIERLLSSIITFKPSLFNNEETLTPILGVYQKLISSKVNDHLGFEFLENLLIKIDLNVLKPFLKQIVMILLTRLQNFRTEKFVKRFIIFLASLSSLTEENKNGWNSTLVIQLIESVQNGLFNQILNNFITPFISKFNNLLDKKILVIGLTNIIVENVNNIDQDKTIATLNELLKLLGSDSIKNYKNINENLEIMMELENDDLAFGSSFNKLNIIQLKPFDPVKQILDKDMVINYFKMKLSSMNGYQNLLFSLNEESKEVLKQLGM